VKIVQAITSLGVGGAERVVLALAAQLPGDNVQSAVVCFSTETDALKVFGVTLDVRIFEMKCGLVRALGSLWSYAGFLRAYRPDIVHAHLFHAFLITLAAQLLSLRFFPIVFTLHSSSCTPARAWWLRVLRKWRGADVVFSEDDAGAPWLTHRVVIPNGVDVSDTPRISTWRERQHTTFIYVGRLVEEKRPAELVAELAKARLPSWKLLMVGSGPKLDGVKAAIAANGLDDKVELLGRRSDVRELLRTADVFLCFSDREGLPMSMLEAGAEGLVVVSTPVGSVPVLLGDDAGFLATKAEYARTLMQVVNDRATALARAANLHARIAERYSTDAMVRAHLGLYRELARSSARHRLPA
jgi:glycosyltransferase involved in cell wall biosynthesis